MSFPRDTRVRIPGRAGYHKINAAFAYGGAAKVRETLDANFGVRPEYTVTLDSAGLAGLVDSLGGIDVTVQKPMDYDDTAGGLHIHLKPGRQRLQGTDAVGFVRFRKDGRGDLGRIERQKTFLKEASRQVLRLGTVLHLRGIRTALDKAIHTDLGADKLLGLGWRFRSLAPSEWSTSTLPGRAGYIRSVSYFLPSEEATSALQRLKEKKKGDI